MTNQQASTLNNITQIEKQLRAIDLQQEDYAMCCAILRRQLQKEILKVQNSCDHEADPGFFCSICKYCGLVDL